MLTEPQSLTILRRRQVEGRTGYSRSTLYQKMSDGLWPRPVRIGLRAVGWPASEVEALIGARVSGKGEDQIRGLVSQLEQARITVDTSR